EAAARVLRPGSILNAVRDTPGFYRALRKTLAELREGLLTGEKLKALTVKKAGGGFSKRFLSKAGELAALLEGYESLKAKGRFVDREDIYFHALELDPVRAGVVWVYGFYDATPLQKKVLLHLARGPSSRWFTPYENHPAFEYAKPFVEWAKGLSRSQEEASFAPENDGPLSRLKTRLFQDDLSPMPDKNESSFEASDLKIFLCPGEPREGKEVARRLSAQLKIESLPYDRGAVLLRDTESYRKILPPAFEDQRVPLARPLPTPLMETLEGKAVLLLVDCFLGGFAREATLDFLSLPSLVADAFGAGEEEWNPSAWDGISREAKVVEGRVEWRRRLSAWKRMKERQARREKEEAEPKLLEAAVVFQKVLEALFEVGEAFRKTKDWSGKAKGLGDWARKFLKAGLIREEVIALLDSFVLFSRFFPKALPAEEFRAVLAALLQEKKTNLNPSRTGGIALFDLMQARGVAFDWVALPGMVEKSIPRLVRQDPLLLDEEREELNRRIRAAEEAEHPRSSQENFNFSGRPPEPISRLALKKEGALEERLLFFLAARSARKGLILTAPILNPLTGAPRTPSLYLFQAAEAVTAKRVSELEALSSLVKIVPAQDWVKPDLDACDDELERILTAFQEARHGKPEAALALTRDRNFYFEGARLLKERQAFRVFTAYDGKIAGSEALALLREKDSLKLKVISASRLETFAVCPLRYFYKYVLGLSVTPEPDRVVQLEGAERGLLMHGILEETLERGLKEKWFAKPGAKRSKAFEALEEITTQRFERFSKDGVTGSPALWAWEQGQIREDLRKVLEKVLTDPDWRPLELEAGFGRDRESEGVGSVSFPLAEGELRLQGFIDRVDEARDGSALRVVDYKTGSNTGFSDQKLKAGT
ncbi:MAG: PD-(D/E)XK nuclease family protein, partial [bacterium]